ncbi:MAG TPA: DUF1848 domain-containing protein [Clostridiales bacterium]|nr:DUF1848 domain-containing protein [Clostridiales bacterium]
MILSVSRRTDIPAFNTEWFFNRLKEGYVLVRNPMNYHQVSKVPLAPDVIDCIVFWTKDPSNILSKLNLLEEYNFYFQVTITPYDNKIERSDASKEKIIESFQKLSIAIGKKKTVWRYDPILLTDTIDIDFHIRNFDALAAKLSGYTERCIISFIDMYRKIESSMKKINWTAISNDDMIALGKLLFEKAQKYGLKLAACSEPVNLSSIGIERAKCIDSALIADITGKNINVKKDQNQRDECGCAASIDIGAYNTCRHGCLYCYANYSDKSVNNNTKYHDPKSPMLIGNIEPGDRIIDRNVESHKESQLKFL